MPAAMSAPARAGVAAWVGLLGFLVLLALVFGAAFACGRAAGPVAPGRGGGTPGMPGMAGMTGGAAPGVAR
ncbi:hypothetical protein ACIQGZ_07875 [Streptomyces sp. NPDC092296]|uniref:hypothetical protein n=1 Tax=Streptomyces sp. NPDC092296 TaxID=3366012 RepID=UPI00382D866B